MIRHSGTQAAPSPCAEEFGAVPWTALAAALVLAVTIGSPLFARSATAPSQAPAVHAAPISSTAR